MSTNGIEKHYNDDWAKAKSRELVKSMIQRTVLQKKKTSEVRVLCFPGIDAKEITQVYDALDIPRQNITGIEREREIARELERKSLGIHLVHDTLEDFVNEQKETDYDVISLDFIGSLTTKQIDTLKHLKEKQQPQQFVLHCANQLRRDGASASHYIAGSAAVSLHDSYESLVTSSHEEIAQKLGTLLSERMQESLTAFQQNKKFDQEKKGEAYSPPLRLGITGASTSELLELLRYTYGNTFYEEHKNDLQAMILEGKPVEKEKIPMYKEKMAFMGATLTKKMITLCKNRNISVALAPFLAQAVIAAGKGRFYFIDPTQSERYHYISESGAPMIGDIYLAHRPDDYIKAAKNLASLLGFPTPKSPPMSLQVQQAYRKFAEAFPSYVQFVQIEVKPLKERTFLGNAAKPILTQERFNEALKSGQSLEEIKQVYRQWASKPLDAWEAAYHGRPYETQVSETLQENSNALSREDLVQMIQEDYPLEEIHAAWPDYSLESLRAYKANVTRGTYDLLPKEEQNENL